MTLPARSHQHYTYEEYLAYERDSGLKHEFEDGQIYAMAGGSRRHNAIASRISAALEVGRKPGCVAFQSDQRVRVLATGRAAYPDASVVCGPIEGDPSDPTGATITNPNLLVEVLSPSTEQDDRGSKWQHYQMIGALRGLGHEVEECALASKAAAGATTYPPPAKCGSRRVPFSTSSRSTPTCPIEGSARPRTTTPARATPDSRGGARIGVARAVVQHARVPRERRPVP